MIKVLLITITSLHCEVHEASLLLSVRACFHIHLISKNLINKTTAKAALTQIISVTNQRMESNDAMRQAELAAAAHANGSKTEGAASAGNGEGTDHGADSTAAAEADPSKPAQPAGTASTAGTGSGGGASLVFPSVYHKDAYLLFRALCKLSMKGLSEEAQYAHSDAIPLQNK